MPFTPLHMGPGIALKSVLGARFSLLLFGFSQVAMDLEPLVRILRDDDILHGWTHSYAGATLIAAASVLLGRPVCQWLLHAWHRRPGSRFADWLRRNPLITWQAAGSGALLGTWSHVLLDSIMHSDMQPLAPLTRANSLLGVLAIDTLHLACVLSAGAGLLVMISVFLLDATIRHDAQQ